MQISKIQIGERVLLGQAQLNLKDEESGIVTIDNFFDLSIVFHSRQNPEQPDARLSWKTQSNGIKIEAWGWTNALGESLADPIIVARDNTKNVDISINFINFKIGLINHCNIDFYEG